MKSSLVYALVCTLLLAQMFVRLDFLRAGNHCEPPWSVSFQSGYSRNRRDFPATTVFRNFSNPVHQRGASRQLPLVWIYSYHYRHKRSRSHWCEIRDPLSTMNIVLFLVNLSLSKMLVDVKVFYKNSCSALYSISLDYNSSIHF